MCGIAGIIGRDIKPDIRRVQLMLDLLAHRGPDDFGTYEDNHVCLGHRRLSIIDLSMAGHQPMVDEGKTALVFNGEIYNFKDLREDLLKEGYNFKSRTDTEVLLHGYQLWGDSIVNRLKGFFAFSVWDTEKQRLFCARDPFGKKPFYYYWDGKKFVFSSEVESLIAGLDSRPDINYHDLSHYLLKGYFPSGNSVYESIHTLKAGCCLSIDVKNCQLNQWQYFYPEFKLSQNNGINRKDIIERCRELIDMAVTRRLESDVPIGVLLSGGVDSSLIALSAAENSTFRTHTFTVTFNDSSFDEGPYAKQIAERAKTEHLEVNVNMDVLSDILPRLIKAYGEPYGDYSAIPTFLLFQAIKPYITVALTGDGGDEVFAGYKDTRMFIFRDRFLSSLGMMGYLTKSLSERMIYSNWRHFREMGYGMIALRPNGGESFYSLERDGWTRFWRKKLMRPEAWKFTDCDRVDSEFESQFNDSGCNDMERYLNLRLERLTQDFLVKIDRASMAHSIEARCPMLDVDIFNLVSKLPYDVLLYNSETKSILKDLLASRINHNFARRVKKGFTPPLNKWFRSAECYKWLEEKLLGKNTLSYSLFGVEGIRWLLNRHFRGYEHTKRLWTILFLNEWHNNLYL